MRCMHLTALHINAARYFAPVKRVKTGSLTVGLWTQQDGLACHNRVRLHKYHLCART